MAEPEKNLEALGTNLMKAGCSLTCGTVALVWVVFVLIVMFAVLFR